MRVKLAMKLGGKYRIRDISIRSWDKLSEDVGLKSGDIVRRVQDMAEALPEAAEDLRQKTRDEGMVHPIIDRLAERLGSRAGKCAKLLALD